MKMLVVDNHDSFVYNLYYYLREMNIEVDVVENDKLVDASGYDKIIISPGPGSPLNARDRGRTLDVVDKFDGPVLGICFGHQLLAYHLGSQISVARRPYHGEIDRIKHNGSSLYLGIPDSFDAIRYHSLVISPNKNIEVDAVSETDGNIMGFHSVDGRIYGIQFHPESYFTSVGKQILKNFVML
ncbi:anthranilate synthase component II [Thermoplasma volcanium GSS1]|uniref:anthranilate synthase n=1 Tax=Thermoplasma volcanium (strain ATCC 51530 / DSM 4299 / JCM 9571 / NBRC 15438 / GSS1) TaxID=273116 RepID=Q979V8_THEVO|nr:aminodeoxychorismate/anthranilate synthase component II [Thermoplasma volcanium]BAB60194.1 anthranilate synthase component II [Thermoplasma volcanium GSS1]